MSHDEVDPRTAAAGDGRRDGEAPEEREERRAGAISFPILLPGALARIALGILILGGMTTGTFFLVTDVIGPRLGPPPGAIEAGARGASGDAAFALPGDQYLVDQLIINPAETRGKRFLRLGVALETQDGAQVLEELETRKSQVRDLFIREFSARSLDELTDPTVREELRVACIDQINGFLMGGGISNLYFTDYVLQ